MTRPPGGGSAGGRDSPACRASLPAAFPGHGPALSRVALGALRPWIGATSAAPLRIVALGSRAAPRNRVALVTLRPRIRATSTGPHVVRPDLVVFGHSSLLSGIRRAIHSPPEFTRVDTGSVFLFGEKRGSARLALQHETGPGPRMTAVADHGSL